MGEKLIIHDLIVVDDGLGFFPDSVVRKMPGAVLLTYIISTKAIKVIVYVYVYIFVCVCVSCVCFVHSLSAPCCMFYCF